MRLRVRKDRRSSQASRRSGSGLEGIDVGAEFPRPAVPGGRSSGFTLVDLLNDLVAIMDGVFTQKSIVVWQTPMAAADAMQPGLVATPWPPSELNVCAAPI